MCTILFNDPPLLVCDTYDHFQIKGNKYVRAGSDNLDVTKMASRQRVF